MNPEWRPSPAPYHITCTGRYSSLGPLILISNNAGFSVVFTSWPSANLAIYMPILMPCRFTVARFMVANGNVVAGNINMGLYSGSGKLLCSTGATAQSGTSAVQYVGITNQSFPMGDYFLALLASSTSARFNGQGLNTQYMGRLGGVLQESVGSSTLPVTMTPAVYAQSVVPAFGFSQSDSF